MPVAPLALSLSAETRFRYVGGHPAVDFVNTVVWTEAAPVNERLTDYHALLRWGKGAELITEAEARSLRDQATKSPTGAQEAYLKARDLRWTLRRVLLGLLQGRISKEALSSLDNWVLQANSHRRLRIGSRPRVQWAWLTSQDSLELPLWPIALAAADLVSSADIEQLRMCAGTVCGWMFIDRSRNGLRRWCEMETCGTSAKTRRRAVRRKNSARKKAD